MVAPEKISSVLRNSDYRFIIKPYPGDYLTSDIVEEIIKTMINDVDAVLVGPGLGTAKETMEAVKLLLKEIPSKMPLIIDADGLKACKGEKLPKDTIVTPHEGEFTILTGKKLDRDQEELKKVQGIQKAIASYDPNTTWVVKGPIDIIVRGEKKIFNNTGTPSMTTGGTGDILAGLITAIRSVVQDSFYAAAIGAFLIGKAGEMADQEIFTLQGLLDAIPMVVKEVDKFIQEDENEKLTKITKRD